MNNNNMSSYPSPGQYNARAMNGGPSPRSPPSPPAPHHMPTGHGHARRNNFNNNNNHNNSNSHHNGHNVSSDLDSHYTNPYSEQHSSDLNGSNLHNGKHNNNNNNNKNSNMGVHRPRIINRKNGAEDKTKSSLTTNFDPMKDRHMWAMWRTAVNGRIVDQVRKNEQFKQDALLTPDEYSSVMSEGTPATYGKDLASAPPLSRFIRLNQKSKDIAQELMSEGQGKLETSQFIYYGLPRVTVSAGHDNRYVNNAHGNHGNHNHHNNHNHPAVNGVHNGYNGIADDVNNMNYYGGGPRMQPL